MKLFYFIISLCLLCGTAFGNLHDEGMEALKKGDFNSYEKVLRHVKDEEVIKYLEENPQNKEAKRIGLSALLHRRSEKARSIFEGMLFTGNKRDANLAAQYYCEVSCLSEKEIEGLKETVQNKKYSLFTRSYAALALSQARSFDTVDLIPAIKSLLKTVPQYEKRKYDDHDCSYLLKYALAAYGVPKYRNGIIDAINNGNELALYKGIIGLGYMGDLSYVSFLAEHLDNKNSPEVTVTFEYRDKESDPKKPVFKTKTYSKIVGGSYSSAAVKALSLLINTDFSWKDRAISDGSLKKWKFWWKMNKDKDIYHRSDEVVPLVPKILMDSSGYPLKEKSDQNKQQ